MLRHFKMELKRQQELESENQVCKLQAAGPMAQPLVVVADAQGALNMKKQRNDTTKSHMQQQQPGQQPKRVRGRRSSKPQMEKRRRARINECLDILKSYVLTDAANLNKLGIDLTASENQDEDTIARSLLKSSGLINRHRGRKNPNKLEKADILELTVDYVRRLHEHRDELLASSAASMDVAQSLGLNFNQQQQQDLMYPAHCQDLRQQVVPAHLNQPLTLDLSPKSRSLDGRTTTTSPAALMAYRQPPNTLLTPPSSSGSLSRQNRADVEKQKQHQYQDQVSQMVLSRALSSYKHSEWTTN